MEMLVLHEDPFSGNCYKIRLLLAFLGLPCERRSYDITRGETRTAEFLARVNANGRIPVLQVGDRYLPESNAALYFLAQGTAYLPDGRFDRADVLRWMFFEQYSHEPNLATLRFWRKKIGLDQLSELQRLQVAPKEAAGDAALAVMDDHLEGRRWFVGDRLTVADIALYAYTHVADEAGFDLKAFPNVIAWCEALQLQPRYVGMDG